MAMQNTTVVAIIQARMASSRLPGKVMADICGKPMIYHVVGRTKAIRNVGEIIIATTKNKSDNHLVNWGKENNIKIFRGSEGDVLKRFFQAAKFFRADIIVRVCADSP